VPTVMLKSVLTKSGRIVQTPVPGMTLVIGGANPLDGTVAKGVHSLALGAPPPTPLLPWRVSTDYCPILGALASVMGLPIRRANSLAGILSGEHSHALGAPPPAPLLSWRTFIPNTHIMQTHASIVS
jgi:hypothetical protein